MTLLATTSQPDHALAYAAQQNRWERGVLWLAGIVCVSQALMVPEGIWFWGLEVLRPFFSGIPPVAVPGSPFERLFILGIGRMLILPLMQLSVAWLCIRMMMGNERARGVLFYLALATVLVHIGWSCTSIAWEFCRGDVRRPWTPFGMAVRQGLEWRPWGLLLGEAVVRNYPLLLLAMVVRRQDERSGRRISAAVIWAMTALACALAALPTTIDWLTRGFYNYYDTTIQVFAVFLDQSWTMSLFGIGVAAGSAACLGIWLVIVYTHLKGPRGRASLMICAALLGVFAIAVPGQLCAWIIFDMAGIFIRNGLSARLIGQVQPLTEELAVFAAAAAFPLALRMALSLSDVRDKLDGLQGQLEENPDRSPGLKPDPQTVPPFPSAVRL